MTWVVDLEGHVNICTMIKVAVNICTMIKVALPDTGAQAGMRLELG